MQLCTICIQVRHDKERVYIYPAVNAIKLENHSYFTRMALRKAESSSGLGVGGRVSGVGKNQENFI